MKRSIAALGALFLIGSVAAGCAPRQKADLFTRWTAQDTQRREEMEREEKIRAEVEARMTGKAMPAAAEPAMAAPGAPKAPAPAPVVAPPPEDYSSLPGGETPPIRTSTPARAIQPEEADDDEAIY